MALHCLLARFCYTYVLCVTLSRGFTDRRRCRCGGLIRGLGLRPQPRAGGGPRALGLLELAVSPPATRPAHAAPTPPIWERLEALPDLVGEPRATSTPKKRLPRPARRRRRLRRREWKPLERVSV